MPHLFHKDDFKVINKFTLFLGSLEYQCMVLFGWRITWEVLIRLTIKEKIIFVQYIKVWRRVFKITRKEQYDSGGENTSFCF